MGVFCFKCEKVFSNQSNLNRHVKEVHNDPACAISYQKDEAMFRCLEGCNVSFKFNKNLREHLQEKHKICQELEESLFSTVNEFEVWLKLREKNENIRYIKTGHKMKKDESGENINLMYFNCARSGKNRMQEKTLKRISKSQGSSKLNQACTSQIIVNVSNKGCLVKFYKSHYGHGENLEHLRLSKCVREHVASKLALGVSKQQ